MTTDMEFIKPDAKKGVVVVRVNSHVFPIDLVYNASYMIMDRAYVILDGSPSETIYVILKPRTFKGKLEELGQIFYDELVAAAFHTVQFVRNKELRETLMHSIVPASESSHIVDDCEGCEECKPSKPSDEADEDFDEKDIATIWEDKFGEKDEGSKNKKR